ncbi:HEAT repeat domain-containing protein [Myxococcota bacterium]|nr:HEAT repeat domain-containing protein [Myxococcota bacterium]MBU1433119.1 HEAT repeat domain-containing protein [Myxococcota bacterium]MBU1900044.1 HEAT repeat domain-containing protein [Myxococcota bacterium]
MPRALLLTLLLASPLSASAEEAPALDVEKIQARVLSTCKELLGNTDPAVRRLAFQGLLALEADKGALFERGLKDADLVIQDLTLGEILSQRKAREMKASVATAEEILGKLLESSEASERARGLGLVKAHYDAKAQLGWYERMAKLGSPDARAHGRALLMGLGGKRAWAILKAGLAEAPESREHKEALEAMKTFDEPEGMDWALERIFVEGEEGEIARGFLVRAQREPKKAAKFEKALLKHYLKVDGDFPKRLNLAWVLANRGQIKEVERTLKAGVRYRISQEIRSRSWDGLRHVRDTETLRKMRTRILTNVREGEMEGAFAWLSDWGKETGEPAVLKMLEEASRSERRPIRLQALRIFAELKHRPSLELFKAAMSEPEEVMRVAAAEGLAAVAKPGDEKLLADYLRREPKDSVKLALVKGLGNIGTPEIIPALQFTITSRDRALKVESARVLEGTGKPQAALYLGMLKRDPDPEIRAMAWRYLLHLKPKDTLDDFKGPALLLKAEEVKVLADDKKIDEAALELIALKGEGDAQRAALDGLIARAALTRLLTVFEACAHEEIAAGALRGIAAHRQAASLSTYMQGLKREQAPVRAAAINAVGLYGAVGALGLILEGLDHREPLVRAEASLATLRMLARAEGGEEKPTKKQASKKKGRKKKPR